MGVPLERLRPRPHQHPLLPLPHHPPRRQVLRRHRRPRPAAQRLGGPLPRRAAELRRQSRDGAPGSRAPRARAIGCLAGVWFTILWWWRGAERGWRALRGVCGGGGGDCGGAELGGVGEMGFFGLMGLVNMRA